MAETVRVGIIGAGMIAQDRHIPLLQKVPDVRVTHAWSRRPETARKAARQFGIANVVDRWERIVEAPDLDAVVIATSPNLHLPTTLAALDCGKHVLCQARMARNLSEAHRMLEASRATDLVTSLYAAGFGLKGDRVMRRLLHQEGYVGDILELRVTSLFPALPEAGAWVVDPQVVGVNTMMLGILAEVVYRWVDPVLSVTALTGEDKLAVPQSLSVAAELPGGATASFHLSFRVPRGPGSSVEIYGTRGVLDYKLLVEKPGGLVEDEELAGARPGCTPSTCRSRSSATGPWTLSSSKLFARVRRSLRTLPRASAIWSSAKPSLNRYMKAEPSPCRRSRRWTAGAGRCRVARLQWAVLCSSNILLQSS